jgi:DNA primase
MLNDQPIDSVQQLLREASAHFRRSLVQTEIAGQYLRSRGIEEGTARRYGLGFARPAWRDLGEMLVRYTDAAVLQSGLVACAGNGPKARRFDRFRNRLMFPIRDAHGAVVGFGGRFVGDSDGHAKYLNSPESDLFRKRELVYGLYEAKRAMRAGAGIVVMEGYVDVLAAQQAGVAGAVGSLGTACTAAQLEALFALGRRVVFCFDGDAAGREAAERALKTVLPLASDGRSVAFALLPDGHDPDSLVRERGAPALHQVLADAKPLREALLGHAAVGCDLRWPEGRSRLAARAAEAWRMLPAGAQRDWLEARVRDVMQSGEPWVREYLLGGGRGAVAGRVPAMSVSHGRRHAFAA